MPSLKIESKQNYEFIRVINSEFFEYIPAAVGPLKKSKTIETASFIHRIHLVHSAVSNDLMGHKFGYII